MPGTKRDLSISHNRLADRTVTVADDDSATADQHRVALIIAERLVPPATPATNATCQSDMTSSRTSPSPEIIRR